MNPKDKRIIVPRNRNKGKQRFLWQLSGVGAVLGMDPVEPSHSYCYYKKNMMQLSFFTPLETEGTLPEGN